MSDEEEQALTLHDWLSINTHPLKLSLTVNTEEVAAVDDVVITSAC